MTNELAGKRIAILVADGFEMVEMTEPRAALDAAGATTVLISPQNGTVKAWDVTEWGQTFAVDLPLDSIKENDFDGLHLPGGVMNPDQLRTNAKAVHFTRTFFQEDKPVSAICHAHWTLVNADVLRGRRVTSWPSLQADLQNAGAVWVNEAVVTDGNLVTSRMPSDMAEFVSALIPHFTGRAPNSREGSTEPERE